MHTGNTDKRAIVPNFDEKLLSNFSFTQLHMSTSPFLLVIWQTDTFTWNDWKEVNFTWVPENLRKFWENWQLYKKAPLAPALRPMLIIQRNIERRAQFCALHRDLQTFWQCRRGHRGLCSPSIGLSAGEFDAEQVALQELMQSNWRQLASFVWMGTNRKKVRNFQYWFLYYQKLRTKFK